VREIEADAAVEMFARVAGTQDYIRVIAYYRRDDPYAVALIFDAGDTQTIWHISREEAWKTFIDGEGTGIGDVRLRLVEHDQVLVRLTSPAEPGLADESMEILLARRPFASMLRRSTVAVPRGAEFHHVDIDRWIHEFLRGCS
jgi:hypothetical protein